MFIIKGMASFTQPPDPWSTTTPAWGVPVPSVSPPEPDPSSVGGLIELLNIQRQLLEDVATGVVLFNSDGTANPTYQARAAKIRAELRRRGVDDPFPWRSLSDWWGRCSREWGTYQERRDALSAFLYPVTDVLEHDGDAHALHDGPVSVAETSAELERRIAGLKDEYARARHLDDYQDVGRRSRAILIDAVNMVWRPSMCSAGEEPPRTDDAKNRFDQIVASRLSGSSYEQLRGWFKSTWALANRTTHSGTAARMSAFASGQATLALTRTLFLMLEEMDSEEVVFPSRRSD